MKKVLIGICGIGNGHVNRQICVIKKLLNEGMKIVVATTKEKEKMIQENFPDIVVLNINIPWITCNDKGVDYVDCLRKYNEQNINQYQSFFEFSIQVEQIFQSKPDIVISDYEPNVAQYAYSAMIPLICMEQQSKFLYLDEINIENFSIKEERYRLNYFFPKYDKKIISSFFPISIDDEKIAVVPPIITQFDKVTQKDNNKIIVYFSPYSDSDNYVKILNAIKNITNYTFHVYSSNEYLEFKKYRHIHFYNFNKEFKKDLESSTFLLSTGGHQLLSEAIALNIPVYVFPLDTYEQQYNALMIEKYHLGCLAKEKSYEEIIEFLSQYKKFYQNIKKFKEKYYVTSWDKEIKKILE